MIFNQFWPLTPFGQVKAHTDGIFFSENRIWYFMQMVSYYLGNNHVQKILYNIICWLAYPSGSVKHWSSGSDMEIA